MVLLRNVVEQIVMMERTRMGRAAGAAAAAVLCFYSQSPASGHMMPYFAWFGIDRQAVVGPEEMRVIHVCRFDPATFRPDHPLVDLDGDTTASVEERADCCVMAARYLAQDMIALYDGRPLYGNLDNFLLLDGEGGFRTEIVFTLPSLGGRSQVTLFDPAYLMPKPSAAADSSTSAPAATASGEGVALIGDAGERVAAVPLASHFTARFTMERPSGPEEDTPPPVSLLEQFERAEAAEDAQSTSPAQVGDGNGSDG